MRLTNSRARVGPGKPSLLGFPPTGTDLEGFNPKRLVEKLFESIARLKAYPEPRGMWDRLAQGRVDPLSRPMSYSVSAIYANADIDDVLKPWHEAESQLRALYARVHRRPAPLWKDRILRLARVDSAHDVARSEALAHTGCRVTRMRHVEWAEHEARELLAFAADERCALGLSPRTVA